MPEDDIRSSAPRVGVVTFILNYENLLEDTAATLPLLTPNRPVIELHRSHDPGPPRALDAAFRIADPYMSGRHARVFRRDGVDHIEDMGSRHGTRVNDRSVDGEQPLNDGDVIEVGRSLLLYRSIDALTALLLDSEPIYVGPTRTLCPEVARLMRDLDRIAPTEQPALLLAETGAGKEIVARHIHQKSGRAGPFVAIDCGAIPEHLVESELFGHKRGAFSGASEERKGRLRSAEGGTVFLDEIGNMQEAMQARLLRVVQEREVVPVGSDSGRPLDVRWISATNADIFAEGAAFRPDLRARLAGYVARLPPLRRRREDLGILTAHLLAKAGVRKAAITRRAARQLFLGDIPGNIRELERTLIRAVTLAGDGAIDAPHIGDDVGRSSAAPSSGPVTPASLPTPAPPPPASSPPTSAPPDEPSQARRKRPSRDAIVEALARFDGNQGRAARHLGVHERQLTRWMDALGIPRARARE